MSCTPTMISVTTHATKIRMSVVLNACHAFTCVSTPNRFAASDNWSLRFAPYQFKNMSMSSSTAAIPAICSPRLNRFTSTGTPPSGTVWRECTRGAGGNSGTGNRARRRRRVRAVRSVGALVGEREPGAHDDEGQREEPEVAGQLDRHRAVAEPHVQVRLRDQHADERDRQRDDRHRGGEHARAERDRRLHADRCHDDRGERQQDHEDEQDVQRPAERRPAARGHAAALEPIREQQDEERDRADAEQRLAAPDAPHTAAPRIAVSRPALTVLRSRQAIVIGPTPPGTGVIAEATSATSSWSTSPNRPSSRRFWPTSMTIAPGFTQSRLTIRARPTAAISTSARRQTSGRSRVR